MLSWDVFFDFSFLVKFREREISCEDIVVEMLGGIIFGVNLGRG